ncbi:peptidoglycan-associated lipoprotein Pal [Aquimonas voraii]|uniref:Peptidoglycan-associated lipoprotein n=1 Tax=Aquimonas voraii TaxID=265719 RepID=A0A1G6ZCI4_9GAMM|nr:peptidoglycan-associated lipoprotein Pal [Aquimonas voraii]SDD99595.1 peptidoglycan-associated lipoprotein [Aquimonas voraii]
MNTMNRLLIAAATVAALAACAKKEEVKPEPQPEPQPVVQQPVVDDGKYSPEDLDRDPCLVKRVVYFDFDKSDIKSEFASILACHAKYLTDRPSARITLEGHADERGSREYNMGLGERRGNAVNGALLSNGGSASQLTVVSYGEERPTCTDSTEGCWGQNRRVEIVYTAR